MRQTEPYSMLTATTLAAHKLEISHNLIFFTKIPISSANISIMFYNMLSLFLKNIFTDCNLLKNIALIAPARQLQSRKTTAMHRDAPLYFIG